MSSKWVPQRRSYLRRDPRFIGGVHSLLQAFPARKLEPSCGPEHG